MFEGIEFIDLTYPLHAQIPTWSGSCGYCLELKQDYDKLFRIQQMQMDAGVGTHMDAPSHRIPHGKSIADIPLKDLFAPACVIDVSLADADYELTVQDVESYENRFGAIPKNALVIAYTGWDRFWSNPKAYRNVDARGRMHFPAYSRQAVELLLKRNIAGIAIDTLSPDCSDPDFSVHKLVLGAGRYIIENIANAARMPPTGGYVIALPISAQEASEAPIRMIGLLPK